MDTVDSNHLIPSDQLDDSLATGQNLECEASNALGTGLGLDESLKNMLSDKDPMFGFASSQFNLLDNEDATFQIAGSTGPADGSAATGISSELKVAEITRAKQPVAMRRKRPSHIEDECSSGPQPDDTSTKTMNRLQKTFVKGSQLKRDLTLGGRVDVNNFVGGLWLNPSVELRRLTVTIAGFRIELLPGPSYTQHVEASQSACLDGGSYAVLPDVAVDVQNPTPETGAEVTEKSSADDAALGPDASPHDVQTANGTLMGRTDTQETRVDNPSVPAQQKSVSEGKYVNIKESQNIENNRTTVGDEEKQALVAQTLLKSKQGPTSTKDTDLVSDKPNDTIKEHEMPQNMPSKIQRGDLHKIKSPKEKKDTSTLKRPAENPQSEHGTKMQKTQETGESKAKPKLPSAPSSAVKKSPSSGNRGDQQGPPKQTPSPNISKGEAASPIHARPGPSLKMPEEDQEKPKLKKPEKILQRQKSKPARSVSVDEPQLFIPDNAPVVKKEAAEEQPAPSESVWDGNNCCGLCKKHHNNMFMVGCGRCDDWFHGDCVGLDLTKVREMEEEDQMYVCLKCCEEESQTVQPETRTEVQDLKLPPQPGPSASGGVRPDADRRPSTDVREAAHKTGVHLKLDPKSKASASKKPVSVEAIRRSVRDSLGEILLQRLKESDLKVSAERASDVAKKTERELFYLYKDTDNKYKNKYRSLMFNLKDTKNNVLFKRVLKGEISPGNLIRMSPEELASKELAAWRQRENRHTIEMIEKEQREAERRPITKITHKGEIEIESQEPVKAPDPEEQLEPPLKVTEDSAEPPNTPEMKASGDAGKDTTGQHKSHLFDLNCKICTGRMAPPVDEAPTKVVKVATTVVRTQSAKAQEKMSTARPAAEDDLHLAVLEESFRSAQSGYEGRSDLKAGREEEAAFLTTLSSLWRGLIHMTSVAKFMTNAFIVSGVLDNLTEDLPDSVQVGGRISPQTVWDYLEKIRATGTKEVCLIRFSPETEEDELSYTLLYAYFSSRGRFGVVSNNLKQVKDMYLIPLGATEKVPHQLVPFDGPGLENNRANLLLGLIIRQRSKRDYLPVDMNETAGIMPEIMPIVISTKETRAKEEEEKKFLSSLTTPHKKEKEKPLNTTDDPDQPVTDSVEEAAASEETNSLESQKPLRFLPGVLLGWGGELPPLPDVGGQHAATADDTQKSQPAPKAEASGETSKRPAAAAVPRERFVIRRKEAKPVKAEPDACAADRSSRKDAAVVTRGAPVSLKDKPPDVSTEVFLGRLSAAQTGPEPSGSASANAGGAGPPSGTEKAPSEGSAPTQAAAAAAPTSSKPPLSGILKKSSAYSSVDGTTERHKGAASQLAPPSPKPLPSSARSDQVTLFHQGYLQVSQAKIKAEKEKPATGQPSASEKEDPGTAPAAVAACAPPAHGPPAARCPDASERPRHSGATPAFPASAGASLIPSQPRVPASSESPPGPPPPSSSPPTQDQNHSAAWAQDGAPQRLPELQSPRAESDPEPAGRPTSPAKDYKRLEERYCDPWERPRATEDRDHHGRPGHHRDGQPGKKSRHRDKKHERGHDRERSRHHGHSDDRYGEKRKERHHGDEHSSRHKDRHRHRRDSDYENGRRSSKDS